MKFSLHVNGHKKHFTEEELRAKLKRLEELEKRFAEEVKTATVNHKMCHTPTEGRLFKINPNGISEELFAQKREDLMQEWTRQIICKALIEVRNKPGRYAQPFVTMLPKKTWKFKTVKELKNIATEKGDHIANWVEQALEWAQRIANGESWENICNKPDTANWYRLIIWEDGYARIVGGSCKSTDSLPASAVFGNHSFSSDVLKYTVPLIVLYI